MEYKDSDEKGYLIAELPLHERPRERLLDKGCDALSDIELIAIILRTGPRGKSTLDLARDLLRQYAGNLVALAAASPAELSNLKGIGRAKSAELKATFALAARMASRLAVDQPKINTPDDAANLLRERFRGKTQEELRILLLDTKNKVIRNELITIGLLDRSQIHAREVFRIAIQHNAAKIVLAHNHPSGDPTPSKADIHGTRELNSAGKIIGIELVDHIIMGVRTKDRDSDFFSFRENSLMDSE